MDVGFLRTVLSGRHVPSARMHAGADPSKFVELKDMCHGLPPKAEVILHGVTDTILSMGTVTTRLDND